jgi:hypothetical protein
MTRVIENIKAEYWKSATLRVKEFKLITLQGIIYYGKK